MIELITTIGAIVSGIGIIIALYNLKKIKEDFVEIQKDERLKLNSMDIIGRRCI